MHSDWLECIIWRKVETWQSVEIVKKVSMIINNDGKWRLSEITISKIYVFISGTESMRFSRVRYPSQHPPVTGLEEDCSISMSREGCQLLISAGPSQSSQNSGSARGKIFQFWSRVMPLSHSLQRYLLTCFLNAAAVGMISHTKAKSGGPGRSRWLILSPALLWRGLTSGLLITKMWLAVWGVFLMERLPFLALLSPPSPTGLRCKYEAWSHRPDLTCRVNKKPVWLEMQIRTKLFVMIIRPDYLTYLTPSSL